jgi:cobalt-zinc-cadmium efflux system outer membrane protein
MKKIVLIYLLCSCYTWLLAEEKPLQLTDLIAEAYARNPKIQAAEKEAQAYSFRIKPAQTFPDPMIEFSLKNMGLDEWMIGQDPNSGIGFSFSQVFPYFGKLALAGNMARKAYEGRLQALEAVKLDIAKQVKAAYFDLFYLQKAVSILEKQKDLMQKALSLAETRYAVGSGIQNDIFKAQLEISRMDEMIIPIKEMITAGAAKLNVLLDYPPARPLGQPEGIDCETVPLPLAQLEEFLLNQSPRLKEAYALTEEKSIMVQAMRKEFKPDLKVTAGWEYKGKLPDMYELMLGLEIPLFAGRKQGNRLQEARAMSESMRLDTAAMRNYMLAELHEYYLRAKTSENLVHLYKTRLLPQARLALEASFAAYPVNKTDFMSLLSDITAQFSAELAYYRELTQLWIALAELESLTAVTLFQGGYFRENRPPGPPVKAFNNKDY